MFHFGDHLFRLYVHLQEMARADEISVFSCGAAQAYILAIAIVVLSRPMLSCTIAKVE